MVFVCVHGLGSAIFDDLARRLFPLQWPRQIRAP